jgi:uncharacterized protein (DUF2062 family)
VPKKFFSKFLPDQETIRKQRWMRPFGAWLQHPDLWRLDRRSVAGSVAVGMFCGLIPGPFQMVGAALMSILFRVNLPLALFTTLYTNPFTIVPLYMVAYGLGIWVTSQPQPDDMQANFSTIPDMDWTTWVTVLPNWLLSLGKPFAIGLPLLAVILAVAGYFTVRVLWYLMVVRKWKKRALRRSNSSGIDHPP